MAAPGRAGGALALAAEAAGHRIVGVISRSGSFAGRFQQLSTEAALPRADLLVVAARDSEIASLASALAPAAEEVDAAIHLSGYQPLSVLAPLAAAGCEIGSFHPLQTLPDAEAGSRSLAGSWVAITAEPHLGARLHGFAHTLSLQPFDLADGDKALYHAAAASSSNFLIAALDFAAACFASAGLPFAALRPLADQAVANAFEFGPAAALTGPIARGDWGTVAGHLRAVGALGPDRRRQYEALALATAITAGRDLPEWPR